MWRVAALERCECPGSAGLAKKASKSVAALLSEGLPLPLTPAKAFSRRIFLKYVLGAHCASCQRPVERCFAVIELLANDASAMRLGEIAERLDLQKSAAHRMLTLLCNMGWAEQDSVTGFYKLTVRLAIVGQRFLNATSLTDVCQLP
ncbi:helix-turn-helix domain-containing protein [Mesorhizobium sp. M0809]|uniref:helix-turn-helix domain-containing protein n=1 Tax=Mesorhizobium sp. M0809 TaxID=2957003 RepID=UPI003337C9F8